MATPSHRGYDESRCFHSQHWLPIPQRPGEQEHKSRTHTERGQASRRLRHPPCVAHVRSLVLAACAREQRALPDRSQQIALSAAPVEKLVFNRGVCRAERNDQMIGQFSDHLLSLKGFRFGGDEFRGFCGRAGLTAASSSRNNRYKAAEQDGPDRRSTSGAIERLALLTTYSETDRHCGATRRRMGCALRAWHRGCSVSGLLTTRGMSDRRRDNGDCGDSGETRARAPRYRPTTGNERNGEGFRGDTNQVRLYVDD